MPWKGTLMFSGGLGAGIVLAGAALIWLQKPSVPLHTMTPPLESPVTAPAAPVTRADLTAVTAALARIEDKDRREEGLVSEVQREVASLRARLTQVRQEQEAMIRAIEKPTLKPAEARRERAAGPVREDAAGPLPSTPEEEVARADAQVQAQIELIEDRLLTEAPDPAWRDTIERSLQDALQREEGTGFHLLHAECRTTMCRLEMSVDRSMTPEESFQRLVHLMSWPGESFIHLEEGESTAIVMYLARDGYALPDTGE